MAGDLSGNKKLVFEQLLRVDVVRGPHSTGVATVQRFNNSVSVAKAVGAPEELLSTSEYADIMKGQFKVFIGHNRFATIGKITPENAHPFVFDKVVGAHNGTLEWSARHKLFHNEKFGTDSEAIFADIDERGLDETVKILANPSYNNNAFALVWHDSETDTINFIRNSRRELFYMYSEDRCTIFWSSEIGLLRWVLDRNNVKTHEDKVYLFEEDTHISWDIPKNINDKFGDMKKTKYEKPEPMEPPWVYQRNSHNDYNGSNNTLWRPKDNRGSAISHLPMFGKKAAKIDTKHWRPPYKDYNGQILSRLKVEARIKDGCVFCTDYALSDFKWGEYLHFLKPDMDGRSVFLCKECYNDDDIRNMCEDMI